jgi:hypothetical protein
MSIEMVKIRAKVTIGNSLTVETPHVVRFSVNKTRGVPSTFSASLRVSNDQIAGSISGDSIKIWAGRNIPGNLIFSGIVKKVSISPNFEDPSFVILNLDGADILSMYVGKKYTKRTDASISSWISIDGVSRPGLRSGKFAARFEDGEKLDVILDFNKEGVETSPLLKEMENVVANRANYLNSALSIQAEVVA